ncbi:hypothetical protein RhiirA4_429804 [Rhizophagus irregularis]|uniref:Uncharacterized protein n=1 Tax=Rhizophagus irregularis TaxID=588596 RepID=A0A2I1HI64_9GLOM|nr:hypothetical protein RhiirA4_429804 [Rhizophagus irregularis]
MSHKPCLVIGLFLSHNLWLSKFFRADDHYPGLTISIPDSAIGTFGKIFHIKYITLLLAIMVNNNTNKSPTKESLDQLYEVFLYKKKDIIAIQKKLGININANQEAVRQSKEEITLADSYELLLDLVGDMLPIQEELNIEGNPILEVELRSYKASMDISYRQIYNLLLCLEDDIVTIQEKLGIVGYTNQERAEEADENARAYLQKFEKFHGPLEDVPSVLIQKFIDRGVKMFYFTGEGLPLFPKVSPQQLHEIFVKNLSSTGQMPMSRTG